MLAIALTVSSFLSNSEPRFAVPVGQGIRISIPTLDQRNDKQAEQQVFTFYIGLFR